jgi:hypothetical protein
VLHIEHTRRTNRQLRTGPVGDADEKGTRRMWTLAAARRSTVIKNRWPTRACSGRDFWSDFYFGARLRVHTPSGVHWAADSPLGPENEYDHNPASS